MLLQLLLNPYTVLLLFALVCLCGMGVLLIFSKYVSPARMGVFCAVFVLVLFSYPFIQLFTRNFDGCEHKEKLPRFTPLALSAQMLSVFSDEADMLLISDRFDEWLTLPPEPLDSNMFPQVRSFAIHMPGMLNTPMDKKFHYILLDCGHASCLPNVFQYYSDHGIAKLKSMLATDESGLIVLLPGEPEIDAVICRTISAQFRNLQKLKVGTMNFAIASNDDMEPITDLKTLDFLAGLLGIYSPDGLYYGLYSIILEPYWEQQKVEDFPSKNISRPRNPLLLRLGASSRMPFLYPFFRFAERYGLYCLGAVLLLYLTIRYFASGTSAKKENFLRFEYMFAFTCTIFCIQYALSYTAMSLMMVLWPLVVCGALLLLDFFRIGIKRTYSILTKIAFSILLVDGIFLFTGSDIFCIVCAALFFHPVCCLVYRSWSQREISGSAKVLTIQSMLGVIFALLTAQFLLFCPYGPIVLVCLVLFWGLTACNLQHAE